MKIALLGYGRMGHLIEEIALKKNHEIVLIVDEKNRSSFSNEDLKKADVAIEFSVPGAAVANYNWCFECGVPVVSGTTGWLEHWDEVVNACKAKDTGFFYASNFSVGVNIFFQVNRFLAKLMNNFQDYKVLIEETHHIHKLDAPSGTAITIAEGVIDNNKAYKSWKLKDDSNDEGVLKIASKREGEVPGIHAVTYTSNVDEIKIYHSAFSREGFAQGAVLAAEFMLGKRGVYNMDDLLKMKEQNN